MLSNFFQISLWVFFCYLNSRAILLISTESESLGFKYDQNIVIKSQLFQYLKRACSLHQTSKEYVFMLPQAFPFVTELFEFYASINSR